MVGELLRGKRKSEMQGQSGPPALLDARNMPWKPRAARTLGFAVWSDNIGLARELLDAGAPVDNYGSDTAADVTPLMEFVDELEPVYDATRVVLTRLLLSAGADVARRHSAGRTALPYAVGAGRLAVELLLARCGRERRWGGGITHLHEAILSGMPQP